MIVETQVEREMELISKCQDVNFDGKKINGEDAYQQMVVHDLFGGTWNIDWDKTPVKVTTKID